MVELGRALRELATRWNNQLDEISPGVFRLDVGIKLNDGSIRNQFVYLWEKKGENGGHDKFNMNSRVGTYSRDLDLYNIIKDSSYSCYSCTTISPDVLGDGTPCETVVVQAAPFSDTTSIDLLGDIIFEVASNADYLEGKYFGVDRN